MAQKQINRAVTVGENDVYLPGMEDQLDDALTSQEVKRLLDMDNPPIEGPFKGKARVAAAFQGDNTADAKEQQARQEQQAAAAENRMPSEGDAEKNQKLVDEASKDNASMAVGADAKKVEKNEQDKSGKPTAQARRGTLE